MEIQDFAMLEIEEDQLEELFESGGGNTIEQGLVMDRFHGDTVFLEEDLDGYPEIRYDTADRTDIPFDGIWTDAEEIRIGAAVTTVASGLWDAPYVERFTVSSRNPVFFARDGVLFRHNERGETVLVKYPSARKEETYTVPEDVVQIDAYAFQQTEHLKHLICTSVLRMDRSFHEMDSLESLLIENTIAMTGGCFDWCVKLRNVSLPDTLVEIEDCFCECHALKGTLELPASLVRFKDSFLNSGIDGFSGESAGCKTDGGVLLSKDGTHLIRYPNTKTDKNYAVPDGVEVIESHAFSGCLLREVTLPITVREIQNSAFRKSRNLVEIRPRNGHLTNVTIRDCAFEDTKWLDLQGTFAVFEDVLVFCRGEESEIRLPAVRAIAEGAFPILVLPTSLFVSEQTKVIESRAFMDNEEIVAISLGAVEEIKSEAFVGISAEKIVIPDSCKGIGKHAFLNAKTHLFVIEGAETQFGEECIGFKRAFGEPVEENPDTFVLCRPGSTAQEYCQFYGIRHEYL